MKKITADNADFVSIGLISKNRIAEYYDGRPSIPIAVMSLEKKLVGIEYDRKKAFTDEQAVI